jgi:hypothetical protein
MWLAPLLLAGSLLAGGPLVQAQTAPPLAVRGTITSVGDGALKIKTAGGDVEVALAADTAVRGISLAKVSEIQPGRYIGTTAVPLADGTLKALEVHVFPPEMAGTGDGHRPWDLTPNSTMTNGAVGDLVDTNGRTITVKYKTGEKKVVVPDTVPVVDIEPGNRSLLVPGTQVVLFAKKNPDGTLTAQAISAGKNGVKPPM